MSSSGGSGEGGRLRVSRLCQPLWSCLNSDHAPLSVLEYFVQFMAARDALHLLQFWFSVTSFRNAASTFLRDSGSRAPSSPPVSPAVAPAGGGGPRDRGLRATEAGSECAIEAGTGRVLPPPASDAVDSDGVRFGAGQELREAGDKGGGDGGGVSLNGGMKERRLGGVQTEPRPSDIARQPSLNVVSDAIGIYSTYISLNALTPVSVPDTIRQRVEVNICPEDGLVARTCFDEAQQIVYDIIETRYYPEFLRSSYFCKYQLELVSSGQLCLLDFLLGGDPLGYLMEFMEAEAALPLLQFWLTAESFHANLTTASTHRSQHSSSEEYMGDAISIYERYFSLQATEQLGMGDEARVEIEMRICEERGPRADSYLPTQLQAYDTMNEKYYPHFLESGPYLKFLDTLLAMVKSTPDDHRLEKPTQATAGPTTSQAETETVYWFPAYDVDDPESLWRRHQLLMRLGCVDEMGHYCSEIDPFPTKTSKSKDQNKHFRRFKNRQEEEEWEYAVKVSRNIVGKVLKRTSRTSFRK